MYPVEVLPPQGLYLNNDGEEAPAVEASGEVNDDKVDSAEVPKDDMVDAAEVPTALEKAEVSSDGDFQDATGVRDGVQGDTAGTLQKSSSVESLKKKKKKKGKKVTATPAFVNVVRFFFVNTNILSCSLRKVVHQPLHQMKKADATYDHARFHPLHPTLAAALDAHYHHTTHREAMRRILQRQVQKAARRSPLHT